MNFITAEPRATVGKAVRVLRKKGLLPAVIYGKNKTTESVSISETEFLKVWKSAGESSLVTLKVGNEERNVLIHDVAVDPIKNAPIHADFYVVDMTKEVDVGVPLIFEGEADVGKDGNGILVKALHEVRVRALPNNLPHSISISVVQLQNPKDSVAIKDITPPNGVSILNDSNEVVAILEELKEEAPEAPPAVSTEEALKNIEVVRPEKKAEESEEKKPE